MAERLIPIELPLSSGGAPLPHIVADEGRLRIGYIVQTNDGDRTRTRVIGPDTGGQTCALLSVDSYWAFQFGAPNDEAIGGHRLFGLGLKPYGSFEVLDSEWIAAFEKANRVHPHHHPEQFAGYRHIILTFHDSTVEFIAKSFEVQLVAGPIRAAVLSVDASSD
jgi:hypothetical protein